MAASSLPLSAQFDEVVACTNVLLPGIEGSKGCSMFIFSEVLTTVNYYYLQVLPSLLEAELLYSLSYLTALKIIED